MRILLMLMTLTAVVATAEPQTAKTPKTTAKASSLTGCVDEHNGQYVLTNDTNLQPTAQLQPAAGSAEDNFARFMGHKVTVQGKLSKEDPLPVMTVEKIVTISETCAPTEGSPHQ